jgi:hypothetical protein
MSHDASLIHVEDTCHVILLECPRSILGFWMLPSFHATHPFLSRSTYAVSMRTESSDTDSKIPATSGPKKTKWPLIALVFLSCALLATSLCLASVKSDWDHYDDTLFPSGTSYPLPVTSVVKPTTLCGSLVVCVSMNEQWSVSRIIPSGVADGAVVIVVPAPVNDWASSEFHQMVLFLVNRLGDRAQVDRLRRNVLLVAPLSTNTSLTQTVNLFTRAYHGAKGPKLPDSITSAGTIHQLLVLDAVVEGEQNEVRILPFGTNGALSNLDFVMTSAWIFSDDRNSSLFMHPYGQACVWINELVKDSFGDQIQVLVLTMTNLGLFMVGQLVGKAPHASALERDIPSLTIWASFKERQGQTPRVGEYVQRVEALIQAMDSLTKTTSPKYIMSGPASYMEASALLLPTLLASIPLLLRLSLLPWNEFDGPKMGLALFAVSVVLPCSMMVGRVDVNSMNSLFFLIYMSFLGLMRETLTDSKTTIHAAAILLCLGIHGILIVSGNMTLACVSFWMWSTLLSLVGAPTNTIVGYASLVICLGLWAPVSVVPFVFRTCTFYVLLAYTPLHMLLCSLWFPA